MTYYLETDEDGKYYPAEVTELNELEVQNWGAVTYDDLTEAQNVCDKLNGK